MSRRRALGLVGGWALSLAVLVATAVALRGRWESVAAAGGLPGVVPVAVAVVLNLAASGVLVQAWRRVLAAAGWRLALRDAAWVWGASQLARYALGAAQIGGRALLANRHGVPAGVGAATAFVETVWQASLNASVVLATLPWWLPGARDLAWVAWTSAIPAAVLVGGLVHPAAMVRAVRWLARRPWLTRFTRGLGTSDVTLDRRSAAAITGWFLVNTGARVVAFLVLFAAVGGDWRLHAATATGAYVLGKVVGQAAVFVPAGIGPREGATALVLAGTIGGAVSLTLVAAARLVEVVAEVAFVAAADIVRRAGRAGRGADDQTPTRST